MDGKIWVFWKDLFSLASQEHGEQMVHLKLTFMSGRSVLFLAVYAKCTRVGRRCLWLAMDGIRSDLDEPWLVAGVFNVISSVGEWLGGAPANGQNMIEFNSA